MKIDELNKACVIEGLDGIVTKHNLPPHQVEEIVGNIRKLHFPCCGKSVYSDYAPVGGIPAYDFSNKVVIHPKDYVKERE